MYNQPRKLISAQMILFELRNVAGNIYVHIFGVGLPVVMAMLISKIAESEMVKSGMTDSAVISMTSTQIYLGMGTLIPMAVILMGYSISYAQELEKGIPERMMLFGIKNSVSLCNRAVSEAVFILAAFIIFFFAGAVFTGIDGPVVSGALIYVFCMLLLSIILLMLGHGIACVCHGFGRTYCAAMMLYFAFMILGGMMGVGYDSLPKWAQVLARLLPITHINKDFYDVWKGQAYNFMPLAQSYLFLGAAAGIILFIAWKRPAAAKL